MKNELNLHVPLKYSNMSSLFFNQFAPKPVEVSQSSKQERIFNFLSVPLQLERVRTKGRLHET